VRRCVEHRAVVELGGLLDAEPEVIDNAFKFWAPGTTVTRDGLERGHPGIVVLGDGLDVDRLEIDEALGDSRLLLSVSELQLGEALHDVEGRRRCSRGFQRGEATINRGGAISTRALELGEAPLPSLLMGIKATGELVDDELHHGIHGPERTLKASEMIVGCGGIQGGNRRRRRVAWIEIRYQMLTESEVGEIRIGDWGRTAQDRKRKSA
jgi:hypothetical protein